MSSRKTKKCTCIMLSIYLHVCVMYFPHETASCKNSKGKENMHVFVSTLQHLHITNLGTFIRHFINKEHCILFEASNMELFLP